jgi:YggT family protein
MIRFIYFIDFLLATYTWLIIAYALLSWLVAFDVINMRNNFARSIAVALNAVVEPALRPIRRFIPVLGGLDISPVILILIIIFIRSVLLGNLVDAIQ